MCSLFIKEIIENLLKITMGIVKFLSRFTSCFIIVFGSAFSIKTGSRATLPSHVVSPPGDERAMLTFSDESRFNLSTTMSVEKFGLPIVRGSSQSAWLKLRKTPPTPLRSEDASVGAQQTQNICITFVQCWTSVEDVGTTLYKCYTNVLCLLFV